MINNSETGCKRVAKVELTKEQIEKIGIRKIGTNQNGDLFETIECISLIYNNIDCLQHENEDELIDEKKPELIISFGRYVDDKIDDEIADN